MKSLRKKATSLVAAGLLALSTMAIAAPPKAQAEDVGIVVCVTGCATACAFGICVTVCVTVCVGVVLEAS